MESCISYFPQRWNLGFAWAISPAWLFKWSHCYRAEHLAVLCWGPGTSTSNSGAQKCMFHPVPAGCAIFFFVVCATPCSRIILCSLQRATAASWGQTNCYIFNFGSFDQLPSCSAFFVRALPWFSNHDAKRTWQQWTGTRWPWPACRGPPTQPQPLAQARRRHAPMAARAAATATARARAAAIGAGRQPLAPGDPRVEVC